MSKYLYSKDINSLIKDDVQYWRNRESYKDYTEGQLYDYFIQHNFKLLRLYIQFKIPKWLNVLNNIKKIYHLVIILNISNYLKITLFKIIFLFLKNMVYLILPYTN